MNMEEATAREDIRKLITIYTVAGNGKNAAVFNTLFTDEGVFAFAGFDNIPGFRLEGRDEICAMSAAWTPEAMAEAENDPRTIRHHLTTCEIELIGADRAQARTYFIGVGAEGADHMGVYSDKLIRNDDRWQFAERTIALNWCSPSSPMRPAQQV